MTLKVKIYIIFSPEDFIHGCGELGYILLCGAVSRRLPPLFCCVRACVAFGRDSVRR